jgi:hypothetical protein
MSFYYVFTPILYDEKEEYIVFAKTDDFILNNYMNYYRKMFYSFDELIDYYKSNICLNVRQIPKFPLNLEEQYVIKDIYDQYKDLR